MGRFFLDQGNVQYFPNVVDEVEFNAFDVFFFYLVNIFFVFPTKDNLFDAGAFGSKDLFPDTTHGENFTPQRDLSGHGEGFLYLSSG